MAIRNDSDDRPTALEVDVCSLDRHFLVGDNVHTTKETRFVMVKL